jgi:outer membrane lipoprotein carrier protein
MCGLMLARSAFFSLFVSLFVGSSLVLSSAYAEEIPDLACPGSYFSKEMSSAQDLLTKIQKTYEALEALEAQFLQRSHLAALEMSEESKGTVHYKKTGRMKWIYEQPEAQVFLVDKTKLWFYQPEENQLVIDNFSSVLITDIPIAFLLGIGDLSTQFKVDKACENGEVYVLYLAPRRAQDEKSSEKLRSFLLAVGRQSAVPVGAEVVDVAGNRTTIWFHNLKTNGAISDDLFKPDFPKGIDVVDRSKREIAPRDS